MLLHAPIRGLSCKRRALSAPHRRRIYRRIGGNWHVINLSLGNSCLGSRLWSNGKARGWSKWFFYPATTKVLEHAWTSDTAHRFTTISHIQFCSDQAFCQMSEHCSTSGSLHTATNQNCTMFQVPHPAERQAKWTFHVPRSHSMEKLRFKILKWLKYVEMLLVEPPVTYCSDKPLWSLWPSQHYWMWLVRRERELSTNACPFSTCHCAINVQAVKATKQMNSWI